MNKENEYKDITIILEFRKFGDILQEREDIQELLNSSQPMQSSIVTDMFNGPDSIHVTVRGSHSLYKKLLKALKSEIKTD